MRTRLMQHPHLPLFTGVLGALMIAFSAIFVRLAETSPTTTAVFRCVYALPPLALLAWREQRRYGQRTRQSHLWGFGAGLFFAMDLVLWHHSINYIGAGLSTVLGNGQVVLVGLVAWLVLRERPGTRSLIAVPVVFFGGVLISGVIGQDAYGSDPVRGAVYALLTAFAYTGFIMLLRQSNADIRRPAGPLLNATVTAAVLSGVVGLLIGDLDLAPAWPAHGWLLLLALNSQVVGWLLISISLPRLPAVVTSVTLMLQPVGSVLLGMLLLAEAPSVVQLAGVATVLAGVALASAPGNRERNQPSAGTSSPVSSAGADSASAVSSVVPSSDDVSSAGGSAGREPRT